MAKTDYHALVTDREEISKLETEFAQNRAQISQKIYTSMTEERLRVNKIIAKEKIKAPVEKVFMAVAERAAKDWHQSLSYSDLQTKSFYRSSKKSHKIPFQITEFQENKVLTIEYYAKDQQFIKTLRFSPNSKNTQTKITYLDLTTGMTSILGWFEKHVKRLYIKRQIIAFKVQIINAQLDLNLIPVKKIPQKEAEKNRMLTYSENAF